MTAALGPNFGNELIAAVGRLPIGVDPNTGSLTFGTGVTSDQQAAAAAVVAAHNPSLPDPNLAVGPLLAAGIVLTSTGNSALNGTYAADPASQAAITSEAIYIQVTGGPGVGTFSNGEATMPWFDASGAAHVFTTTQFVNFGKAVAQFVTAVKVAFAASMPSGKSWSAPANTYTIA